MIKNNTFVLTIKKTLQIFSENEMSVYSGYATLYILMALIPLLMLVISIINFLPWFSVEDISKWISMMIPGVPSVQAMITGIIDNLNSQTGGLIASVSALTTLWSASNGVSAIQVGLEQIGDIPKSGMKGKPRALIYTVILILFLPLLLLTQLLKEPLIALLESFNKMLPLAKLPSLLISILRSSGPVVAVMVFFGILISYCWLPKENRTIHSQMPGTIFSFVASVIFTLAFSFFMGHFWKASSIYGSLAAIFLTAMWLKFIVTIIFYGAALNEALVESENS